jgi:hypothetical protein
MLSGFGTSQILTSGIPYQQRVRFRFNFARDFENCVNGPMSVTFNMGGDNLCVEPVTNVTRTGVITYNNYCALCNPCVFNPFTVNATATNETCEGNDGSVSVSTFVPTTNGQPNGQPLYQNFTYEWSDASGNAVGNTLSVAGLAAGTYTVTVTSDVNRTATSTQSCSVTATVVVNQSTNTLNLQATATDNCAGGAIGTVSVSETSGFTGTLSYAWSNGATSQNISGLADGTYSVTVSSNGGCTASANAVVGNGNTLQANLSVSYNYFSCDALAEITISGGSYASYAWSNGSTSPVLHVSSDGLYSVTVTNAAGCMASAITTINIGANAPTNTVVVGNTGGSVALSNLIGGVLPSGVLINSNIILYGQMKVDADYEFSACNIQMGPGAEIVIQSSVKLRIMGCTVKSVGNGNCYLHRGIHALPSSELEMMSNSVSDAQYAVHLEGKVAFNCSYTVFDRNFVAVYSPVSATLHSVGPPFTANTITCTAPILAPYPGMVNAVNQPSAFGTQSVSGARWAWAGMHLNNMAYWQIDGNSISRLANGVLLYKSDAALIGNEFKDIPAYSPGLDYLLVYNESMPTDSLKNGNAVYARGTASTLIIEGFGSEVSSTPAFERCRKAVKVDGGYSVGISNCYARGVVSGFLVRNCVGKTIYVVNNRLEVSKTAAWPTGGGTGPHGLYYGTDIAKVGIQLSFNRLSLLDDWDTTRQSCVGNVVTVDGENISGIGIPAVTYTGTGIQVSDSRNNRKPALLVESNKIHLRNAHTGINLVGVGGKHITHNTSISGNRIWCEDRIPAPHNSNANRNGIVISDCNGMYIEDNTISREFITVPNTVPIVNTSQFEPRGISVLSTYTGNAQENTFACNRSYLMGTGFYFAGNCSNTNFTTNDIGINAGEYVEKYDGSFVTMSAARPNYVGIFLPSGTATMGDQTPNKGNRWFGNYTGASNNYAARNVTPGTNAVYYNANKVQIKQWGDPTFQAPQTSNLVSPSVWFELDPFSQGSFCNTFQELVLDNDEGGSLLALNTFEASVVEETYSPSEFAATGIWQAHQSVYAKIDDAVKVNEDTIAYGTPEYIFYDSLKYTTVAEFKQVEDFKKLNTENIESLEAEVSSLEYSKAELIMNLRDADASLKTMQNDTGLSSAALQMLMAQKQSLMNQMLTLQQNLLSKSVALQEARSSVAEEGSVVNTQIAANACYKEYKRDVNIHYLSTLAKGKAAMTVQQYNKLKEIAEKCFLEAGEAVFEARAMLSLYEVRDYSDYDICTEAGYAMKQDEAQDTMPGKRTRGYLIYPVPAKDFITLRIVGKSGEVVEIEIADALGRLWLLQKIGNTDGSVQINVGMLPNGSYICRVKEAGVGVYSQKISVVR